MFHYLVTSLFYTFLTSRIGNNYLLTIQYNFCWDIQCFDDVTTFVFLSQLLQVLFLHSPKFSGFLLMTCKVTLIAVDMHIIKIFTPLSFMFTQNMLCEVMLTLLRLSYFVVFEKMIEKILNFACYRC